MASTDHPSDRERSVCVVKDVKVVKKGQHNLNFMLLNHFHSDQTHLSVCCITHELTRRRGGRGGSPHGSTWAAPNPETACAYASPLF